MTKYKPAELKDTKANKPMNVDKFMMKSQLRSYVSFALSLQYTPSVTMTCFLHRNTGVISC